MIVPTEQMSLAIGKEGQNARLAYKLTGWRIDVKDPESLLGQDNELLRQARAALAEAPDDALHGPATASCARRCHIQLARARIRPVGSRTGRHERRCRSRTGVVSVFYNRELRAKYNFEDGAALPLYEEASTE